MKLFKRVLAAGAALMMAVTGMAMSASAATWSVYFTSGGACQMSYPKQFSPDPSISYFYENCNNYTQVNAPNGGVAYVKYRGAKVSSTGTFISYCCSEYYHYNTQSIHKVNISSTITSPNKLKVEYTLIGNGNNCSMNGDVYA